MCLFKESCQRVTDFLAREAFTHFKFRQTEIHVRGNTNKCPVMTIQVILTFGFLLFKTNCKSSLFVFPTNVLKADSVFQGLFQKSGTETSSSSFTSSVTSVGLLSAEGKRANIFGDLSSVTKRQRLFFAQKVKNPSVL